MYVNAGHVTCMTEMTNGYTEVLTEKTEGRRLQTEHNFSSEVSVLNLTGRY
jgi:hypothetical protein